MNNTLILEITIGVFGGLFLYQTLPGMFELVLWLLGFLFRGIKFLVMLPFNLLHWFFNDGIDWLRNHFTSFLKNSWEELK